MVGLPTMIEVVSGGPGMPFGREDGVDSCFSANVPILLGKVAETFLRLWIIFVK